MSIKITKTKAEKKNPPVAKVRVGLVSASIWENKTEKGTFYNATFDRRYKDSEGNYQSTGSYNLHDLLALSKAADLAHTAIIEALSEAGESAETEETDEGEGA